MCKPHDCLKLVAVRFPSFQLSRKIHPIQEARLNISVYMPNKVFPSAEKTLSACMASKSVNLS